MHIKKIVLLALLAFASVTQNIQSTHIVDAIAKDIKIYCEHNCIKPKEFCCDFGINRITLFYTEQKNIESCMYFRIKPDLLPSILENIEVHKTENVFIQESWYYLADDRCESHLYLDGELELTK